MFICGEYVVLICLVRVRIDLAVDYVHRLCHKPLLQVQVLVQGSGMFINPGSHLSTHSLLCRLSHSPSPILKPHHFCNILEKVAPLVARVGTAVNVIPGTKYTSYLVHGMTAHWLYSRLIYGLGFDIIPVVYTMKVDCFSFNPSTGMQPASCLVSYVSYIVNAETLRS